MSFRKPCNMPFHKLVTPFTLTADDVNKLFVIPPVVVRLAILSLLTASITQQYTMKRLSCVL